MSHRKYHKEIKRRINRLGGRILNIDTAGKHLKVFVEYQDIDEFYIVMPKTPSNKCWERGIEWNLKSEVKKRKKI